MVRNHRHRDYYKHPTLYFCDVCQLPYHLGCLAVKPCADGLGRALCQPCNDKRLFSAWKKAEVTVISGCRRITRRNLFDVSSVYQARTRPG